MSRLICPSLRAFRFCCRLRPDRWLTDRRMRWSECPISADVRRRCGQRSAGVGVGIRPTRRRLLRRDSRLGGEPKRQLGDRAERVDGRPGPGHLGLELRVRRSSRHLLRRDPRLGGELRLTGKHFRSSVTELSASTGALVQVISGREYGFEDPDAISSDGTHVWVPSVLPNSRGDRAERGDGRSGPGHLGLELWAR